MTCRQNTLLDAVGTTDHDNLLLRSQVVSMVASRACASTQLTFMEFGNTIILVKYFDKDFHYAHKAVNFLNLQATTINETLY